MKQIYALFCLSFLLCSVRSFSQDTLKYRDALDFDGYNDRVTIQPDKAFDFATGTVEAWVQPKLLSGANMIILGNRGNDSTRYSIHMNAVTVGLWNSASYLTVSVPTPFRVGAWYHIAVAIDTTTAKFYVDGKYIGSTQNGIGKAKGRPIQIGNTYDILELKETYNGIIDEVKFWNRMRTADEIKNDMYDTTNANASLVAYYKLNEGSGTKAADATGNGRNGTLYNFALTGDRSNWIRNYTIGTPAAMDASDVLSKSFTANWQAPVGDTVTSYLLDVATDIYFTNPVPGFQQLNVGNVLSYPITKLTYSQKYYYRVRAIKQGISNPGPYSNTILVTTLPRQTKFFVNAAATAGLNNGVNWNDAFLTLDSALVAVTYGDTIWVAKGVYLPKENTSYSLKDGTKVFGGFAGTETSITDRILSKTNVSVLRGNNSHVLINTKLSMQTELDGFTISNGGHQPLINESLVFSGGGMYNVNSSFIIRNCTFANNTAGAQNLNPGTFSGGAIYDESSSPSIINCIFDNNSTRGDGGAIFNTSNSSPVIQNSVFSFNHASGNGGAMVNSLNCNTSISGSLFYYNNSGIGVGDILYNYTSAISLLNCTVTNNSRGFAFSNKLIANISNSSVIIGNSIVTNNVSVMNPNDSITITYSLLDYSFAGKGNIIRQNPMFTNISNPAGDDGIWATADDGLQLQASSSAINAGSNDILPKSLTTDLLSNKRIYENTVDMGSYEYSASLLPVTWLSFGAKASGCNAILSWTTASETNVKKYTVEKSTDGVHFTAIADLNAKNSTGGSSYSYTYEVSGEGTEFFKISSTEKDGTVNYTSVQKVNVSCDQLKIAMAPNPVKNILTVSHLKGTNDIQIYSMTGQQLLNFKTTNNSQTLDMSHYSKGMYLVKVTSGTKVISSRIVMKQ